MKKVLYIDDEEDNLVTLEIALSEWFTMYTLSTPTLALDLIKKEDIKVLLTDQRMPKLSGLELAKKVQEQFPTVVIIIITAFDDNETMLKAINQGGIFRYLLKPWDIKDLRQTIESAFESQELRSKNISLINKLVEHNKRLQKANNEITALKNRLEEENVQLKEEIVEKIQSTEIVGHSKVIRLVVKQLEQAAKSDASILLLGETGTGKDLFAKTIHALSRRKAKVMVSINCAAIPENLIESELFGHEKGAFTGADKLKYGKFEIAHEGTLFLDEIGELPINIQPKLLRALQENELERIGGTSVIKTDFRLISATNKNLELEIERGTFRSDLYYRLNIIPITVPPLRNHADDIPLLVQHFLNFLNKKTGRSVNSIPKKSLERLMEYHWPGNIRELENIIERAHVLSMGSKLEVGDWFTTCQKKITNPAEIISIDENEKQHIIRVLKLSKWKIRGKNGAAELLQINPSTLESRMKKLDIKRPV